MEMLQGVWKQHLRPRAATSFPGSLFSASIVVEKRLFSTTMEAEKRDPGNEVARAVVGYGVKIFLPSPPNYVTRSPGI